MSEKAFTLDIVTPKKVVFSGPVVSFTAPGVMGSFQVLFNHAPLLAAVGVGEAKLREPHGAEIRYATSGGFVDVVNNHVVMLAETADRAEEIDTALAQSDRDRARQAIAADGSPHDVERAKAELEVALNRIRVAGRR
jgi:F-type H+-transporting ATPase subunit epsilon